MKKILVLAAISLSLITLNSGCSRYNSYRAIENIFPGCKIEEISANDYMFCVITPSNDVYIAECFGMLPLYAYKTTSNLWTFKVISGVNRFNK